MRRRIVPGSAMQQIPTAQSSGLWSSLARIRLISRASCFCAILVIVFSLLARHDPRPDPALPPQQAEPTRDQSTPLNEGCKSNDVRERGEEDRFDSLDPRYRPLCPLGPPEEPFPRLLPTRYRPAACMDRWFSEGELVCGKDELGAETSMDATWLWVNGSDPRWRTSMLNWRAKEDVFSPEHHFREQNELVYSMRSVVEAMPGAIRTFHLVVADFEFTINDLQLLPREWQENIDPRAWRVAQTPTWLDFSKLGDASNSTGTTSAVTTIPRFRYAVHSEIFQLPRPLRSDLPIDRKSYDDQWKMDALPNFNSMSIESRLGWLPDLDEVTLALNDDFFILSPHAVSDFHSPLYGSVIRFDPGYYQQVKPILDKTRFNDAGEVSGLYHANYILSKRFPRRLRPYFAHAPKVVTRSLHHEASLMFQSDLTMSSRRRFREVLHGEGDIQIQWLLLSLRVERWREALLWTYVVARMGQTESSMAGTWDSNVRRQIFDLFDLTTGDDDVVKIEVHKSLRLTLEANRLQQNFAYAGWQAPKATEMLFSSMDGHMPPVPKPGMPDRSDRCVLELAKCFGPFWTEYENVAADVMFKRLTFQHPECGDCLISALVTASGPLGLSAFFPPQNYTFSFTAKAGSADTGCGAPPHLPLTPTWQEADFSLPSVLTATSSGSALPVRLREWTMKLLSRYQYLSGKSNSHFHMLFDPTHAREVFGALDADPTVSILGLNDDIDSDYEGVKGIMNEWFERRWPKKLAWERGWDPALGR